MLRYGNCHWLYIVLDIYYQPRGPAIGPETGKKFCVA